MLVRISVTRYMIIYDHHLTRNTSNLAAMRENEAQTGQRWNMTW